MVDRDPIIQLLTDLDEDNIPKDHRYTSEVVERIVKIVEAEFEKEGLCPSCGLSVLLPVILVEMSDTSPDLMSFVKRLSTLMLAAANVEDSEFLQNIRLAVRVDDQSSKVH